MLSQSLKAIRFDALHSAKAPFVMASPWDLGSARIAVSQGHAALEINPQTLAVSYGLRGGILDVTMQMLIDTAALIASQVDVPVNVDLGPLAPRDPLLLAAVIDDLAEIGICGLTLSDECTADEDGDALILPRSEAVARVAAARRAADALAYPFLICARSDMLAAGEGDLEEAAGRLQEFQRAGADVLELPGLHHLDDLKYLRKAVLRPLSVPLPKGALANKVTGERGDLSTASVALLGKHGVARICSGDTSALIAYGSIAATGRTVLTTGKMSSKAHVPVGLGHFLTTLWSGSARL